ncbi:hypothetical protein GCM10015535_64790 [Streptomyces gelaticus]|uniref:Uncharacterized protein n=1 Tax=Streptomyces gelaticus TaxID=285446 RepID=A0ABQ2WA28_9ACTN|nr:hypothetical protein GCM10015535_64790 [Streptomyces gelaticus]
MNMRASACASAGTGKARARRGSTLRGILGSPPSFFLPPNTFSPQPLTRTTSSWSASYADERSGRFNVLDKADAGGFARQQ